MPASLQPQLLKPVSGIIQSRALYKDMFKVTYYFSSLTRGSKTMSLLVSGGPVLAEIIAPVPARDHLRYHFAFHNFKGTAKASSQKMRRLGQRKLGRIKIFQRFELCSLSRETVGPVARYFLFKKSFEL